MTMTSFLRSMIWRGGDNDRRNAAVTEAQCLAELENKKMTTAMKDWFENRSQSASNIPEINGRPRRPSTLRLFGNSKKLSSNVNSADSCDSNGSKTPSTLDVEDVVKEFEDNYKSPTRTPTKKSKNFVKKLVAALERRQRDNEVDEVFSMRYSSRPVYAYENSGTIRKSKAHHREENKTEDHSDEEKIVAEKADVTAPETTSSKTAPKIIGAFLKKPVQVDDTSIYWIPIISDKKLPRKKSFRKLLAKLTGRNESKRSEMKTKQVVFASQTNLIEEIHDSGYEGRSTSSSTCSLTSFADTLMYHGNSYVDSAYRDCEFTTFATSSPSKKIEGSHKPLVKRSKDLSELFPEKEDAADAAEFQEDSGYISNFSIFEESMPKKNLVSTRIDQISYELAKLPKHPFARSEPRLYQQNYDDHQFCEEITTLRKHKDEPIYDVPQQRPRSSIFDESLSMKRRNLPVQTVVPFGNPEYSVLADPHDDDQQTHYATVKPSNGQHRVSYDHLCPSLLKTSKKVVEDTVFSKESLHYSCVDLTANQSFVITMYV